MYEDRRDTLVSVITPCYNSEKTIRQTLESVLNQTYQNYEYIIVDGASKDATLDIIAEYGLLFGSKLKVISEPDDGIYEAMNKGIIMASGDIIGIVNSDDFYEKETFEKVITSMTDDKYQIVYGMLRCLDNDKEIRVEMYHHDNIRNKMITHPTCFVTKSVYEDYGMYDTSFRSSADYEFMFRVYEKGGITFVPIYEILSNMRLGGMSSSEIGYRETIKLQHDRGNLGRGRYIQLMFRSYLHDIKTRLNKKGTHYENCGKK